MPRRISLEEGLEKYGKLPDASVIGILKIGNIVHFEPGTVHDDLDEIIIKGFSKRLP